MYIHSATQSRAEGLNQWKSLHHGVGGESPQEKRAAGESEINRKFAILIGSCVVNNKLTPKLLNDVLPKKYQLDGIDITGKTRNQIIEIWKQLYYPFFLISDQWFVYHPENDSWEIRFSGYSGQMDHCDHPLRDYYDKYFDEHNVFVSDYGGGESVVADVTLAKGLAMLPQVFVNLSPEGVKARLQSLMQNQSGSDWNMATMATVFLAVTQAATAAYLSLAATSLMAPAVQSGTAAASGEGGAEVAPAEPGGPPAPPPPGDLPSLFKDGFKFLENKILIPLATSLVTAETKKLVNNLLPKKESSPVQSSQGSENQAVQEDPAFWLALGAREFYFYSYFDGEPKQMALG